MSKKTHTIQTKYGDFSVQIWYDPRDKAYLVETKGFDRTMTFGATITEAKRMAKELIELLVESAMDEGKVVVDEKMRILGQRVKPGTLELV